VQPCCLFCCLHCCLSRCSETYSATPYVSSWRYACLAFCLALAWH
jgi:hypothetical protein